MLINTPLNQWSISLEMKCSKWMANSQRSRLAVKMDLASSRQILLSSVVRSHLRRSKMLVYTKVFQPKRSCPKPK